MTEKTKAGEQAAIMSRIDERTIHLVRMVEKVDKDVMKTQEDINGIGGRLSRVEARVDSHGWAWRMVAGAVFVAIVGYLIRSILGGHP